MEAANKGKIPLPNRLGIKGWAWAGRYKIERYLYTLHRITGFGLLLYISIHLIANGFRLGGRKLGKPHELHGESRIQNR